MPDLPEMFGKYKIKRELGRGANGVVYDALDTTLDRDVAIKVLQSGIFSDPVLVSRFEREGKSAAQMDHPHIGAIYELGEVQGMHYIAMKLIVGQDLKHIIQAQGPLPLDRTTHIIAQIAEALDYAHARGLIHRDVKPGNVMVGENDYVTVTDFGLVKVAESSAGLSSAGSVIGTPAYMAPELWDGQDATAQSDIYALGIVAYEMLTGSVPFDAGSPASVMRQHLNAQIPAVARVNPNLPSHVQKALERALAKQPAQRFKTAGEFAAALATAPAAVPQTATTTVTSTIPGTTGTKSTGGGATGAQGQGRESTQVQVGTKTTGTQVAEGTQKRKGSKTPWVIGVGALLAICICGGSFLAYVVCSTPGACTETSNTFVFNTPQRPFSFPTDIPVVVPTKPAIDPVVPTRPNTSSPVVAIVMALGFQPATGMPINPTVFFNSNAIFHAVVAIQNAPFGSTFEAVWVAQNVSGVPANTIIGRSSGVAGGTQSMDFYLAPTAFWFPGVYRVDIYMNGIFQKLAVFSVQ